ncbi:hypothetical protein ACJX0J_032875, partial [Zea mays]
MTLEAKKHAVRHISYMEAYVQIQHVKSLLMNNDPCYLLHKAVHIFDVCLGIDLNEKKDNTVTRASFNLFLMHHLQQHNNEILSHDEQHELKKQQEVSLFAKEQMIQNTKFLQKIHSDMVLHKVGIATGNFCASGRGVPSFDAEVLLLSGTPQMIHQAEFSAVQYLGNNYLGIHFTKFDPVTKHQIFLWKKKELNAKILTLNLNQIVTIGLGLEVTAGEDEDGW